MGTSLVDTNISAKIESNLILTTRRTAATADSILAETLDTLA
jgi:hypothetical protein